MLKFTNLSLRRGPRELLHDISATIHQGQRVGITGANGAGKSSLFALIRGQLHADSGDYFLPANTVIAHVAQETPSIDEPAIEYVIDGDSQLRDLEHQLAKAEADNNGELLATIHAEMDSIGAYTARSRAAKLMHGLGFAPEQDELSVKQFSGGWRMRLNLAQALMCRSDLLLLDEPTNHLDLETVIWLEDWLRAYDGTLLLISHDRDFLDRVTTHIAHIEQQKFTLYTGNYSAFEVRRAEQLAQQQSAYEKQQTEIAHMQSFVDRFGAKATKARQAQSRVKALERMKLISQAHVDSPFDFSFRTPEKIPNPLIVLRDVNAGYGDKIILDKVKMEIRAGDRIGLLGHNGAGKSTLIKLLAGEISTTSGERTDAKDVRIGYFAQHQLEQLDSQASPLLHLQRIDPKATEKELRNFLGGFAFNGDMATSPVAPFSGGEKARLVLAMLVYQRPNLLLLDEPTNHLDLEMRHALTVALQDFDGAMVIVSHDRHMLRTVADTLFLVADGKADLFSGDLDDYRQWVKDNQKTEPTAAPQQSNVTGGNKKQQRQESADLRKKLQPLRNKLKKLEQSLEKLNTQKTDIETRLGDASIYEDTNKSVLTDLLQQQSKLGQELEAVEMEWMEISEQLEGQD
ncbi:MAG: ATP-binding cassette domain-containing protein [Gammaproteobacteria bacterium]|nr:ATP-binding cassette domain-containing protein [Gammaproteobacteria bacterium]